MGRGCVGLMGICGAAPFCSDGKGWGWGGLVIGEWVEPVWPAVIEMGGAGLFCSDGIGGAGLVWSDGMWLVYSGMME